MVVSLQLWDRHPQQMLRLELSRGRAWLIHSKELDSKELAAHACLLCGSGFTYLSQLNPMQGKEGDFLGGSEFVPEEQAHKALETLGVPTARNWQSLPGHHGCGFCWFGVFISGQPGDFGEQRDGCRRGGCNAVDLCSHPTAQPSQPHCGPPWTGAGMQKPDPGSAVEVKPTSLLKQKGDKPGGLELESREE